MNWITIAVLVFCWCCAGASCWLVWINHKRKDDSERLDWLDRECKFAVAEGQNYGNPYGEHVANEWHIEWPAASIRDAIDAKRKEGGE